MNDVAVHRPEGPIANQRPAGISDVGITTCFYLLVTKTDPTKFVCLVFELQCTGLCKCIGKINDSKIIIDHQPAYNIVLQYIHVCISVDYLIKQLMNVFGDKVGAYNTYQPIPSPLIHAGTYAYNAPMQDVMNNLHNMFTKTTLYNTNAHLFADRIDNVAYIDHHTVYCPNHISSIAIMITNMGKYVTRLIIDHRTLKHKIVKMNKYIDSSTYGFQYSGMDSVHVIFHIENSRDTLIHIGMYDTLIKTHRRFASFGTHLAGDMTGTIFHKATNYIVNNIIFSRALEIDNGTDRLQIILDQQIRIRSSQSRGDGIAVRFIYTDGVRSHALDFRD